MNQDWHKFTIFNDSNHDFTGFGLADIALADEINPGDVSTFDGDLSAFRDGGGKFLTYHGRRDQASSPMTFLLLSST